MPTIAQELNASYTAVTATMSLYLLAAGVGFALWGPISGEQDTSLGPCAADWIGSTLPGDAECGTCGLTWYGLLPRPSPAAARTVTPACCRWAVGQGIQPHVPQHQACRECSPLVRHAHLLRTPLSPSNTFYPCWLLCQIGLAGCLCTMQLWVSSLAALWAAHWRQTLPSSWLAGEGPVGRSAQCARAILCRTLFLLLGC